MRNEALYGKNATVRFFILALATAIALAPSASAARERDRSLER